MYEEYRELCERMKQYRIHYPLTQSELAERSGVSARSISRFENGEDIGLDNFMKLLRAMDLADRLVEMIPDQTRRPSFYLNKENHRSRARGGQASGKRDSRSDTPFVWGDEK